MAALNFPDDRSGLVPPGTGPLQDGDIWRAPNGVNYTWNANGSYWSATFQNDSTDKLSETFLRLDTANAPLLGDLTIGGSNQITLKTDGEASFAKKVTSQATVSSDPSTTLVTKGYLESSGGSGGTGFVQKSGDNMTGNLTLNTDKIELNTDGTATFASDGLAIESDGQLTLKKQGDQSVPSLRVLNRGSNQDETASIYPDGSATFSQRITSGSDNNRGQFLGTCPNTVTASSADAFIARYESTDVFTVKYNGNATFVDSVNVQPSGNPATRVNLTGSTGEIFCATDKTDATEMVRVQGGRGTSNQADVIKLKANGTAEFNGSIDVGAGGRVDIASDTATAFGAKVETGGNYGAFIAQATSTSSVFTDAFVVARGNQRTAFISATGKADFTCSARSGYRAIVSGNWQLDQGDTWTSDGGVINNPVIAANNGDAGRTGIIVITIGSPAWGSVFKFPGGTAPTITSTPAIIPYYCDGTNMLMGSVTQGIS